ncbi:MAG: helix-turn-helix transcriptional regulator [Clostridia bacterium]|nr:helix-turn-helix transcriptional regulator [Clostridia bacterium]
MKFGDNFKKLRLQSKLSQQQVAKALGINQSNVSNWEKDVSRPEYENLIQLSKLYGVTISELLGIDEY